MTMNRGSVSGPNHHVDNPVLRELTQIEMKEATANNHANNTNRPHCRVSWPARTWRGGSAAASGDTKVGKPGGGGGGGIENGSAGGGAGVNGSIPL